MPMINCLDCNKVMSESAQACPNCGRPNDSLPEEKKPIGILLGVGIFLIPLIFSWFTLRKGHSSLARVLSFSWLALSIVFLSAQDGSTNIASTTSNDGFRKVTAEQIQQSDNLTGPQRNAVRSARQYHNLQGFSREGLIQQLSSDFGDGYKVTDATAAVDSLNIDWNKEAVRSAKQYLNFQGFSCQGLIEQLSSSAGDKYTVSQATYGAQQAGACQ